MTDLISDALGLAAGILRDSLPFPTGGASLAYHRGTPMRYGDEQAFLGSIQSAPLDWQNHLVFADWLEDQNSPEAGFRRAVGNLVRARAESPWTKPQTSTARGGPLAAPPVGWGAHPEVPVWHGRNPGGSYGVGPFSAVRMRPAELLRFDPAAGDYVPADVWGWVHASVTPDAVPHGKPSPKNVDLFRSVLGLAPDEDPQDFYAPRWWRGRGDGWLDLPHMAAFGIRDLAEVEPGLWPEVERVLRTHWNRNRWGLS